MLSEPVCAPPARTSVPGDAAPDDSAAMFGLLLRGQEEGLRGALLTLVDREGGSPRAIGAQMAVLEDGRFTGYLFSGCLETVLAAEAVSLIARGENAILRFGAGSPFFDIRLPCGGSIDLLVDVTLTPTQVRQAVEHLTGRRNFGLRLGRASQTELRAGSQRTGWHDGLFTRGYAPALQMVVAGRGQEFEAVARLAAASGYVVQAFGADDAGVARLGEIDICVTRLLTPSSPPQLPVDAQTAVILLFHDHDWDVALLRQVLASDCRYIGAMGSRHTHRLRCERLISEGYSLSEIARIHSPIGLFGPTRDASTLAISVLAELAQLGPVE